MKIRDLIVEACTKSRALAKDAVRKAITLDSGFSLVNQEEELKNMVPVFKTPIRDRLYRTTTAKGNGATWKILASLDDDRVLGYVPEGKRAAEISETSGIGVASPATLGLEDSYTTQAELMGESLTNVPALMRANTMQAWLPREDRVLLFANRDFELGAPEAPVGVAAVTGSLETKDYFAVVVALTGDGWYKFSNVVTGLIKKVTVRSPAGEQYDLNAGCSAQGDYSDAVVGTSGDKITWTVDTIPGAIGYAFYVAEVTHSAGKPADTAFILQAVSPINKWIQTVQGTTGQTLAALALGSDDFSKELLAPGGIYSQAIHDPANPSCYYDSMDGAKMTMTNGLIEQVVNAVEWHFSTHNIEPQVCYMSAKTYNMLNRLSMGSSNPRVMFNFSSAEMRDGMLVGGRISGFLNTLTGSVIPIEVLHSMNDGRMVFARWDIPIPGTTSPRSVEFETYGGLWDIDWAQITMASYHGLYEVGYVKMYAPFCFLIIDNIDITE